MTARRGRKARRDDSPLSLVRFHPATLLLAWGGLVVFMQSLSATGLAWAALVLMPLPLLAAGRRAFLLLRRARWLLSSIVLLFVLATPGQRLAGLAGELGITWDGIILAAEHLVRLVLLLVTLAFLHQQLGTPGMMAGLYWLLAPLAAWRNLRERIVVRLMLVLEHVERSPAGTWREWLDGEVSGPDSLALALPAMRARDGIVLVLLALSAAAVAWSA